MNKLQLKGIISDLRKHAKNWVEETFTFEHGEALLELADILEQEFLNKTKTEA